MASRQWIQHTVSNAAPTSGRLGDEFFDPGSNTLTKRVAINGSTVTDAQIPIFINDNLGIGASSSDYKLTVTDATVTGDTMVRFTNTRTNIDFWLSNTTNWIGDTGAEESIGFDQSGKFVSIWTGNVERMRVDSNGNVAIGATSVTAGNKLQVNGVIADQAGNVRDLVNNTQGGAYILTAADNGKLINITTGGVTVNINIFSAGNNVTIYNNSAASQTITQGASVTMYLAGTATTGNRTLSQRGIATIVCVAANTFVISGSGLS